jgi:type II secretory pathway pseudopilin PulG
MELVVVMAILAALAAILVPMFPNLLRRAHKVTDTTQTSEVNKALQLYQASFIGYPYDFDMLTDGTGFPIYLPGASSTVGAFGGFVQATTLTTDELAALDKVGITSVQSLASATTSSDLTTLMSNGSFRPTMYPYSSTVTASRLVTSAAGTASKNFAVITAAQLNTIQTSTNSAFMQSQYAADPTARYVVFGVGPRTSMVGQTIQDAPTSVPQEAGFTPANTYCRVGVIFKVSGNEVNNADNRAKFVAAVALEDDELESTEKDLIGYYEVSSGTSNPATSGGS